MLNRAQIAVSRGRYPLAVAACSLLFLAGCGSSSISISSGSNPPPGNGTSGTNPGGNPVGGSTPTGSNNTVVGTPSIAGTVSVIAGSKRNVAITFTSSDGRAISGFGISGSLGSVLPPGWTGPSTFACAKLTTGSGCVLNLTYAPMAAATGTLTLDYVFINNATVPKTGDSISIAFVATTHNNVVASASPTGQVNALVGSGSQPVTVTFNTDDGNPATNFALTTALSTLPAGWTSASPTLVCAAVSTGSGCELDFTFAPTIAGSGALSLSYTYSDNAGIAKTGSLNIAYAGTLNDNVVGTPWPSGQVNAVVGAGSQSVSVTFTTDDGRPASALQLTTSLSSLPTGWSSTLTSFTCSTVSTGAGCQLPLTYAPTGAGNGTLTLLYSYVDDSGNAKTGSVGIPYRATTGDNIVATPSSSSLGVLVGSTTPVTFTFTTDDHNPATTLSITSDLNALPAGWTSGSASFTCPTVSTGTGCQLGLTYAPTAAASGTLSLAYAYTDDSGAAKTGTATLSYAAMPPPHLYLAEATGTVQYCLLNSDGTLGSCADAGGSFSEPTGIVFAGANRAYVSDYNTNLVYLCAVASDGSFSACTAQGSNFSYPLQLAISGNHLYVNDAINTGGVTTCAILADGSLQNCTATTGSGTFGIAANATYAYVGVSTSDVQVCTIDSLGVLAACATTGSGFSGVAGITLSGGYAYVSNQSAGTVSVCAVSGTNGTFGTCADSSVGIGPNSVAFNGSHVYVDDVTAGNVYLCGVDVTGALTSCAVANGSTTFGLPIQIAVH